MNSRGGMSKNRQPQWAIKYGKAEKEKYQTMAFSFPRFQAFIIGIRNYVESPLGMSYLVSIWVTLWKTLPWERFWKLVGCGNYCYFLILPQLHRAMLLNEVLVNRDFHPIPSHTHIWVSFCRTGKTSIICHFFLKSRSVAKPSDIDDFFALWSIIMTC